MIRMQEMVLAGIKFQKFSGGHAPKHPEEGRGLRPRMFISSKMLRSD